MAKITFDYSKASGFVADHEMEYMKKIANDAKDVLVSKTGAGNDFLGWIDLPVNYDKDEFARIKKAAKKIQADSEVLVVIGIGGSYLGARAAIEFLRHGFYNNIDKSLRNTPEIYYVGNNISSTYISGLIDVIGNRDFRLILFLSQEQPQNRQSHSEFLRKCLRRNTDMTKPLREYMPQQIRPREH